MRIFPALIIEVCLSAFILGPLLTEFDLGAYLHDWQFRHYLLNMFGVIHFELPGIFPHNPYPGVVNRQLWTVPFELRCYELLVGMALLGLYRRNWLFLIAVAGWGGSC